MTSEFGDRESRNDGAPSAAADLFRLVFLPMAVSLVVTGSLYWVRTKASGPASREMPGMLQVSLLPPQAPSARAERPGIASALIAAPMPAIPSSPPAAPAPEPIETASLDAQAPVVPMPAAAPASLVAPNAVIAQSRAASRFQAALLNHLAQFRNYPAAALHDHVQGTVEVLFLMERDGRVLEMRVKTSSGAGLLDREALDTLRRAQPLPAIPRDLPSRLRILLPVAFNLS